MANEYKSLYLKDVLTTIDEVAVDTMMVPCFSAKFNGETMTLAEISNHNSLVAMHNEGIREMAKMLKIKLCEEDKDD